MNEPARKASIREEQHLKERIASLLAEKPYLRASTLAQRIGCSRAAAGMWKRRIEQAKKGEPA